MNGLFLHVRHGFELEARQELIDQTSNLDFIDHTLDINSSGYVFLKLANIPSESLRRRTCLDSLIFSRQLLWVVREIEIPSSGDRVTPIMSAISSNVLQASGANAFSSLLIETPDNDEAKTLSKFCKSLTLPLENAMNKAKLLPKGKGAAHLPRVHVIMLDAKKVLVAFSDVGNSSPWSMGVPRLKFPNDAPSRSTLKLDEAFQIFLGRENLSEFLNSKMTAVDLGACPGGWTYQFVKRGIKTVAVDNGAIDQALMQSGLVTHVAEDAFKFRPETPVDWLVCDVVEQPSKITQLIAEWLVNKKCKFVIFNLKLPMKRRYEEVYSCLDHLEKTCTIRGLTLRIKAKQLYHDRKEVTVFATSALKS